MKNCCLYSPVPMLRQNTLLSETAHIIIGRTYETSHKLLPNSELIVPFCPCHEIFCLLLRGPLSKDPSLFLIMNHLEIQITGITLFHDILGFSSSLSLSG